MKEQSALGWELKGRAGMGDRSQALGNVAEPRTEKWGSWALGIPGDAVPRDESLPTPRG